MTLQWISCDARTGRVITDLATLEVDWPLRRTIGQYDTATAHLHLDGAPPSWRRATLGGGAVLHVYDDGDPARRPQWSGLVTSSLADSSKDVVDLTLVTGEGYFDRRFVRDAEYKAVGQNAIVRDLALRFGGPNDVAPYHGLPLSVVYTTAGNGTARDRNYFDQDDATLYSRLRQLMGVTGGPEWVMEWDWSPDRLSILPTLLVGDRIGTAPPAGLRPPATFELPGCVTTAQLLTDYSSGKGANLVQAVSSGQGDVRPTSGPVWTEDPYGRPTFEHRWTPSTSITDENTLLAYAQRAIEQLAPGAAALALSAAIGDAPRLGTDWHLGDDVQYVIGAADRDGRPIRAFEPSGLTGTDRCLAYEITANEITPILAVSDLPSEEDVA